MKSLLIGLLLAGAAMAHNNDLTHRPRSFAVSSGSAVFVDFKDAHYLITYDITNKSAKIKAEIQFDAPEAGFPIFDSVEAPESIMLDGKPVEAVQTKTPAGETTLRYISKAVKTGSHKLTMEVPLKTLVEFKDGGVKSAFWTSDLSERQYLERYMPANFEFDQVKMNFTVKFEGLKKEKQAIYTNGVVTEVDGSTFKISYPSYFTSSSLFFHTVPQSTVKELKFTLKSIDGREIPSVVYVGSTSIFTSLDSLKRQTTEIFQELESDYGPFPHPSITVYNAGMGGMEYCGATMTSVSALGHELFHSYFARGVMPANGNSGWLDEALASWRDNGYQSLGTLAGSSGMSSHPYYTRTTDRAAYSFGERFMRLMDGKLKEKGGLKPFMRHMVENRKFSPLFVEEFIKEMGEFYSADFSADFQQYTFGKGNSFSPELKFKTNQVHRKMTVEELKNYL